MTGIRLGRPCCTSVWLCTCVPLSVSSLYRSAVSSSQRQSGRRRYKDAMTTVLARDIYTAIRSANYRNLQTYGMCGSPARKQRWQLLTVINSVCGPVCLNGCGMNQGQGHYYPAQFGLCVNCALSTNCGLYCKWQTSIVVLQYLR